SASACVADSRAFLRKRKDQEAPVAGRTSSIRSGIKHVAKVTKSFQYGNHEVTLETVEIALQASGAVMVSMGGTVVLVTAVAATKQKEGQHFFPLTVDYVEKFYSAGRIPGGFFKREGRPTEKETLTSRLIDRPVRPLFPDDF